MKKLLTSLVAIAALNGVAAAEGHTGAVAKMDDAKQGMATLDFSGFYAGGHLGAVFGKFDGLYDNAQNFVVDLNDKRATGVAFGLQIGGMRQFANGLTIGAEADISLTNLDVYLENDQGKQYPESIEGKLNSFGSIRGRLGYVMGNFMPYVTAGVGFVNYEFVVTDNDGKKGPGESGTIDDNAFAGVFGGGVEYMLESGARLRLEGLYYAVRDGKTDIAKNEIGGSDEGDYVEMKDVGTIRIGVSFPF